jgi:hypothetical protein
MYVEKKYLLFVGKSFGLRDLSPYFVIPRRFVGADLQIRAKLTFLYFLGYYFDFLLFCRADHLLNLISPIFDLVVSISGNVSTKKTKILPNTHIIIATTKNK